MDFLARKRLINKQERKGIYKIAWNIFEQILIKDKMHSGSPNFKQYTTTVNINKNIFFQKTREKFCRFKNIYYLCTR